MPNAKDLEITGGKNIILYGPAGSGKTTLVTTIPGRKYMFMLDQSGLDTIAGLDIDYDTFFPEILPMYLTTLKGKKDAAVTKPTEPKTYIAFERSLQDGLKHQFENHDVIAIDSLTTLNLVLMDRMLWMNGRQGHNPDISDYLLVGNTIMQIFRTLTALKDKTIILTAHSDLVQDELSKKVFNQIDVMKNVRRLLPRIFSDVWITRSEGDATGRKFVVQTAPSRDYLEAKNSMDLDYIVDVTIDPSIDREKQGISFVRPTT